MVSGPRNRRRAAPAVAAVAVVAAGGLAASLAAPGMPAAASASRPAATPSCKRWVAVRPPDPGAQLNALFGVAVLSARNIWAVGDYTTSSGVYRTLIERWNGRAWKRVPSPNPGKGSNYLSSVTAVSPSNIWAAGDYSTRSGGIASNKTLILHWNGRSWKQVRSPSPGSFIDELGTVGKVSASNIWAVGSYAGSDTHDKSLILHWNGRSWRRVKTPSLKPGKLTNTLESVTVLSSKSAWAVGVAQNVFSVFEGTAIEMHWNGRSWSMMKSPAPGGNSGLFGVQATSRVSPWAVGEFGLSSQVQRTLVFRCR